MDLATGQDGKLYALPWTTDTWAMVYRSDVLKDAGIYTLPTTWEDLKADSNQVHAKTGKTGFGYPAGSASSGSHLVPGQLYWWAHGKALIVQQDKTFLPRGGLRTTSRPR